MSESNGANAAERDSGLTSSLALSGLCIYACVFIGLSVDILVRVWSQRANLEPVDLWKLFFFETSRSVTTIGAVLLVVYMILRRNTRAWRPLAAAIAFAAVWQTKTFAFSGFPGAAQEAAALWLRAHHVPTWLLIVVFGSPAWSLWCAAAALVLFSSRYPVELSAGTVLQSGTDDRSGLLGGSGVAGADLGTIFRRVSVTAIQREWLRTRVVTASALVWSIAFQLLGDYKLMVTGGVVVLLGAAGIVVTNLRAGAASNHPAAFTVRWLARAAISGAALFALSAGASVLLRGGNSFVAAVLLGTAPLASLICCWIAVAGAPRDARDVAA